MTNPALGPGARVGHFTVVRRLGAGGMGEVYRAHDERLKRDVALKVLPRDTLGDPSARARLLREARSAAALNHPHICTIHEVGEEQGRDFIAMELVEGKPLNEVGGVSGFAPTTTVRIGIEIASALAHAHEHGVIHRDLKSANVMLTSDASVKVMDFGLARLVPTADAATLATTGQSLTEAGAIVGTTHYLPPEVLGGAEADARSDIWALGVMLHEMTAGELPFDGQTRFEVAAAIMHSPPRALPQGVPAGLQAVIARCLEKEPARRYQRAGEVRAALEAVGSSTQTTVPQGAAAARKPASRRPTAPSPGWPVARVALGALGALVVGVATWIVFRMFHPQLDPSAHSLAVLPLENLSRDPDQTYFADGMTEEISTRLAQISALRVIAQSSVSDLVKKRSSLPDIGRALRVPVVLRGSVFRAADQVKITVQLVKAATGELMWAQSYERKLIDVLALQSEVALAIANQIQVHLTPQEHTRLAASRQVDPEAYQAYLKGRAALTSKWSLEAFNTAEKQFRHAIDVAPDYAPAWAGLADAAYQKSSSYLPPNDAIPRAREAAAKALALDESLAEAHTSNGIVLMVYDWDWVGAEREFKRAVALRPGDANAHLWLGRLQVLRGQFDDGLANTRRALDLDPLSLSISANLGWNLHYAGREDEALRHLRGAIAADPGSNFFDFIVGLVLEQQGDHAGAVAAFEKSVAADANNDGLAQLAHGYGTAGRRKDAERMIAKLLENRKTSFMPAGNLAYAYTGLGDREQAFRWLDLALEDHSEILTVLKVDPGFDLLRSDPRFAVVLRRVGLQD